jgi:hypothetical protein
MDMKSAFLNAVI